MRQGCLFLKKKNRLQKDHIGVSKSQLQNTNEDKVTSCSQECE